MNHVLLSFLLLASTSLIAKPLRPAKKLNTTPKTTTPDIKTLESPAEVPASQAEEKGVTPDLFPIDGSIFFTGPTNLYLLNPGLTVDSGVFYLSFKSNSKTTYPTSESKSTFDTKLIGQKVFVGYRSSNLPFVAGLGLVRIEIDYKYDYNYSSSTYTSGDDSNSSTYAGRFYGVFPTLGIVLQNGFYTMLGLEHQTTEHKESSNTDARPTLSIGYNHQKLNLGLSHAVSKSRGTGEDKYLVYRESQKLHALYWLNSSIGLDFNLYKVKHSDKNLNDETHYQDSYSVLLGVDIKGEHSYYSFDIFETTPNSKKPSDKYAVGQYYATYGVVAEGKWKVASLYDLGLRGSYSQGSGKHSYQKSNEEITENEENSTLVLELTGGLTF